MLFDYSTQFIILTRVSYSRQEQRGEKNSPIEVREPSKHPFQFVRVLGASRSPASQPKQSTKFYSGAPGWAFSRLLDGWSGLAAVVVVVGRWTLQVRATRE